MRVVEEVKGVLLNPKNFFKKIEKDKTFSKHFVFLVILVFFVMLFLTYTYIQQINQYINIFAQQLGIEHIIGQIPLNLTTYAIFYFSLAFIFILLSFLRYWITHWFVLLFKGKRPYRETYKAMVYGKAPEYITAPLFLALLLLLPFITNPIAIVAMVIIAIPFIALSIYQIYIKTIGLAKLQKISNLKSFLSIYVLGFITQLLIVGVIELILLLILAFVYIF